MDPFEFARRQVIARVAAGLAEAIRRGDHEAIELCTALLRPHPRRD